MNLLAVPFILAGLNSAFPPAEGRKPFPLMVGDAAPRLEVGQWVKGSPVEGFRPGQVYVIEFWATWCRPCRQAIPHLTELQARYKDRVTVVGVSVWEPKPEKVQPFVQKQGDRMAYTVARDDWPSPPADAKNASVWAMDHGKMSLAWMKASGWAEEGIPAAFIVDGQGRIAWVGEPEELDEPLSRIVAGRWDLIAETVKYTKRVRFTLRVRAVQEKLNRALREKEWPASVRACDEMLALDPAGSAHIAGCKFQTLLLEMKDPEKAYAFGREALDRVAAQDASALGQIAYVIANMAGRDGEKHLDLALAAATRANDLAKGERPGVLETLARIYFLKGDAKKAVEYQKKALAVDGDDSPAEMKQRLEKYQQAMGATSGKSGESADAPRKP